MTRFEKAYIKLYNDEITFDDFPKLSGIPDPAAAWDELCAYREKVLDGEIEDPRDKYHKWTRSRFLNERII